MIDFTPFTLADRAFLQVTGNDAAEFLQGQISNDIDLLKNQSAIHALILTPQGKILADLFIYNFETGYLLDLHTSVSDWLLKRFNMFKLRSDVNFTNVSDQLHINISQTPLDASLLSANDPRTTNITRNISKLPLKQTYADAYHHYMATQAIIEFGTNYQASEHFPQDLWFDKLGSISFTKGCYVGQEVVSRMRHKSDARKRLLPLHAQNQHQKTDKVLLNDKAVGEVICQIDNTVLAMMRMDKLTPETTKLDALTITRPEWIQNL